MKYIISLFLLSFLMVVGTIAKSIEIDFNTNLAKVCINEETSDSPFLSWEASLVCILASADGNSQKVDWSIVEACTGLLCWNHHMSEMFSRDMSWFIPLSDKCQIAEMICRTSKRYGIATNRFVEIEYLKLYANIREKCLEHLTAENQTCIIETARYSY